MPSSDEFKRFFHFNASERRGVFVLIALLFALFLLMHLKYGQNKKNPYTTKENGLDTNSVNTIADKTEDAFHPVIKPPAISGDKSLGNYKLKASNKRFDPNKASKAELISVGFFPEIAERILNYRTKGGSFKRKEDLKRIYGVTELFYQHIKESIDLDTNGLYKSGIDNTIAKALKQPENFIYDLNSISYYTLSKLIQDSLLASKILKFKNALGGFHNVEQLKELETISDSVYHQIQQRFKVNSEVSLKKINLNLAQESDLKSHPYIRAKLAKLILAYRQNKAFDNIEELKRIPLVSNELFQKLQYYVITGQNQ
jgi:competence protein ComEA